MYSCVPTNGFSTAASSYVSDLIRDWGGGHTSMGSMYDDQASSVFLVRVATYIDWWGSTYLIALIE